MGSLDVDIEALEQLAPRVRGVRMQLDHLGQNLAAFEGAVGSRRLNRRLAELAGNWRHHRERLGTELEALAVMVASAAEAYRQQEAEIAAAVNTAVTPADG